MKVCHVTSSHSRYDGRIFQKECVSLSKKYDVTLLCSDLLNDEINHNVKIKSIGVDNKSRINRFFIIPGKISKEAIKIDADVYHIHDPELISLVGLLKKKGKKVVFDSHEDNVNRIDDRKWIPKTLKPIVKKMYQYKEIRNLRKADAVITVADYIFDRLSNINKNTYVITNFPILEDYEKQKRSKEKIICFAGGVEEKYMHHNIISALYDLDILYYIAGPYNQNYLNKLSKLDQFNKVKMLGKVSKDECNKLYLKSFAGLVLIDYVPNINYKKGSMGITKIFEYMQYGLPVIATDLDVWKDIVPGKCGICVNPNNIDEIHDAIKYLIDNPVEANKMGLNGMKLVKQKYNWNTQEIILFNVYKKLEK